MEGGAWLSPCLKMLLSAKLNLNCCPLAVYSSSHVTPLAGSVESPSLSESLFVGAKGPSGRETGGRTESEMVAPCLDEAGMLTHTGKCSLAEGEGAFQMRRVGAVARELTQPQGSPVGGAAWRCGLGLRRTKGTCPPPPRGVLRRTCLMPRKWPEGNSLGETNRQI